MPRKSTTANLDEKTRMTKIIELLEKEHPDARIALDFDSPLELLVATILSAQCTDERVNIVTKTLFKKYRRAEDYANADMKGLEHEIRSTGFYKNKARNIKKCCQMLVERFDPKFRKQWKKFLNYPASQEKPLTSSCQTHTALSKE